MARTPKLILTAVAVATAAVLTSSAAQAGGYGLYLEGEFSQASIDRKFSFAAEKIDRDFKSAMGGVGFIYDSNVARDEPINYRIKIGYRHGRRKWDDETDIGIPSAGEPDDVGVSAPTIITFEPKSKWVPGLTFNQTVGYGFIRTPLYRVWAGPTLRLDVDWYGVATNLDVVDLAVGGGPELGINYHLNDHLSLSASLSYNFLYIAEHFETTGTDRRLQGSQHLLALTVSLLFRNESDRWGE